MTETFLSVSLSKNVAGRRDERRQNGVAGPRACGPGPASIGPSDGSFVAASSDLRRRSPSRRGRARFDRVEVRAAGLPTTGEAGVGAAGGRVRTRLDTAVR